MGFTRESVGSFKHEVGEIGVEFKESLSGFLRENIRIYFGDLKEALGWIHFGSLVLGINVNHFLSGLLRIECLQSLGQLENVG